MVARAQLIGLTDAAMPPLPDAVRGLLDGVRHTAYTGALVRPTCLVSLSPMTHDPLFVARLLHHPAVFSAAAVYDFIPLDEPDRYLPDPDARLEYHISLRWLARHDLFLPISKDAAGRLGALLGVRAREMAVTGAPLDPRFEATQPHERRHVLVIGGGDPRKNPEVAVRAHAQCSHMQVGVRLMVTGGYSEAWVREQRRTAQALGGDAALIEAPGHVDDAALARLYAEALCVVSPSRAEGFSLPVVEAMAAGAPVLASRIPVHQELISDTALLFDAEDDAALAALLDRVADPAWREPVLAAQAQVWPAFRAAAVAGRFWDAVAAGVKQRAAPAVLRGARPRVAMLTPLPPDRSGVADYSAAMCAELGRRVRLDLFSATADPPCPPGAQSVEFLSARPLLSSEYDRVVSVLGNSHYHVQILEHVLRYGGACIAHDGRMLDVYHAHVGQRHTERLAEQELGRPLWANEIWHWLAGDLPPGALILREIAEVAEPLMLHSRATVAEVQRRYGRTALHLPFSQYRAWAPGADGPHARRAARERMARLGAGPQQVVLATFGFVAPTKAPEDCIWALELLRGWGVDARLHFVGEPLMQTGPLERLCAELGVREHVWFADGFVDETTYRDHLLAADVGVQLRQTGAGSVSGALADCVGAGLRSVASTALADAIEAPGYVRRVPDNPSPVLLAEAVATLLDSPAAATGPERLAYVGEHGFDRYAMRLCEALGLDPGAA